MICIGILSRKLLEKICGIEFNIMRDGRMHEQVFKDEWSFCGREMVLLRNVQQSMQRTEAEGYRTGK